MAELEEVVVEIRLDVESIELEDAALLELDKSCVEELGAEELGFEELEVEELGDEELGVEKLRVDVFRVETLELEKLRVERLGKEVLVVEALVVEELRVEELGVEVPVVEAFGAEELEFEKLGLEELKIIDSLTGVSGKLGVREPDETSIWDDLSSKLVKVERLDVEEMSLLEVSSSVLD